MAKISFDYAALVSNFSGNVQKIESGVRAIESDRTIYAAMREGKRASADAVVESAKSESRYHIMQDAYRAAKMQGWRDEDALEYGATAAD